MQSVIVELGARSYPVVVGAGVLGDPASYTGALGSGTLVVTSRTVATLHLDALTAALGAHPHSTFVLPDGDAAKTLASVESICAAAAAAGLDRDGTFIALGGGAVGDATGLAAALYLRGVGYLQLPTTLLSQVDAAVGGKTAVNLPAGKNLVGAFHQPRRVVADVATLRTLPPRELRAGLGEVLKYALLGGGDWLAWFEADVERLAAGDTAALEEAVLRCCRAKAAFVAADEHDTGARMRLNLGHTFGHALETAYGGALLHGEAVALGCVMAGRLSQSLGWLTARDQARVVALAAAAGLPTELPTPVPSADALLALMGRDKKRAAGVIRLVLLRGPGTPVLCDDYPHAALVLTLRDFTMTR